MKQKYYDASTGEEQSGDGTTPMQAMQSGRDPGDFWKSKGATSDKAKQRLAGILAGKDVPPGVSLPPVSLKNDLTRTKGMSVKQQMQSADEIENKNDGQACGKMDGVNVPKGIRPGMGALAAEVRREEGPGTGVRIHPPKIKIPKVPKFDADAPGPAGGSAYPTQSFDGKAHPGFKAVQSKIEGEGYSKDAAGAILASKTRAASPAAKKANPKLNKV